MAEGFARSFGIEDLDVLSAGSRPSGRVNPTAIKLMEEAGIDISKQRSKGFFGLPYKEFDYVVTMGCKDTCPFVPSKETIDWDIEVPTGNDLKVFRRIRDDIKKKVANLIEKKLR